jgi:hypothetical protein
VELYEHPVITRLQNFEGVDTLERAVSYLHERGGSHNNPILSTHQAGKTDAQADHLAFYQANVFGKKVYATAVFTNHAPNLADDLRLTSAIATAFSKRLGVALGDASIFYINGTA